MKRESTRTQVFALIAALALSALLASGCSVAPVSGNSVDSPSSTSSYSNCIRVMTSYGATYQCNAVTTPTTYSYTRYTYTKTGLTSKVDDANMTAAYAAYLSTLSKAQLADLNAQWDALASSK